MLRGAIVENIAVSMNPTVGKAVSSVLFRRNLSVLNVRTDFSIDIRCGRIPDNVLPALAGTRFSFPETFAGQHFWMTQVVRFARRNAVNDSNPYIKVCMPLTPTDLTYVLASSSPFYFREMLPLHDESRAELTKMGSDELHLFFREIVGFQAWIRHDGNRFDLAWRAGWEPLGNNSRAIVIEIDPRYGTGRCARDGCSLKYSLPQRNDNNWCVVMFPEPTLVNEIRMRADPDRFRIVAHEFMDATSKATRDEEAPPGEVAYRPNSFFFPNTGVLFQLEASS